MIQALVGHKVVIDLNGPFVCLGKLLTVHETYLELENADLHDLRDTQTTRENYVVESKRTGIKQNRRNVMVMLSEVVAISRFKDVIDE